jgi:secondary thiamine-phosphate synthase enzyme
MGARPRFPAPPRPFWPVATRRSKSKGDEQMSRSSSETVRVTPVEGIAASGPMLVRADPLLVHTDRRIQLVDITERIMEHVRGTGIAEGIVSLWSMHTTCALFINEAQRALHADILSVLESLVDRDAEWQHNDPSQSDCDRMNADSHLRAMFLGHSVILQVSGGEPVLGQWQRIIVAEMDGPRARTIRAQVMGIG